MHIQLAADDRKIIEKPNHATLKAYSMDEKLLFSAQQFEQKALSAIYDQFSPPIYRYSMRMVGDVNLAEDLVAETFTRFLHAIKSGKGPKSHLQAYLFRIAHNLITDYYRRQPQSSHPVDEETIINGTAQPRQIIEDKSQQEQTRLALMQLTSEQNQVIVLRFLEGLDNDEVAEIMNKPVGAIKALQHRALINLRKMLYQPEDDDES